MNIRRSTLRKWFPPDEFYTSELCSRCGICCGSTDGHPCEHLVQDSGGKWSCAIYEERLGPHHTVTGHPFICVRIKFVIETTGGYAGCEYVKEILRRRIEMGQDVSDLGRAEHP